MRRTSWLAILLVVVLGSGIGIVAGRFLAFWGGILHDTNTSVGDVFRPPFDIESDGTRVRILMIGEDDTSKRNSNGNGLSDTLVVFSVNTDTKEVRALSIPRDTRVEIPGHGTGKINSAHVYGGPELTKQVVNNLLGLDMKAGIKYYIKTNTTGLREMVDLLGGVYIVVDKNMRYTDRRGGLHIDLHASPDKQLLNGRQAEGYVRFRHDADSDYGWRVKDGKRVAVGRVVRQQYFMRSLANRVLALPDRHARAEFLAKCYDKKYIVSNLNIKDWDALADWLKDIKPEEMAMQVLPGRPQMIGGGSYVVPDEEKLYDVVSRYILFQGPVDSEEAAKVEVLNGSGRAGAAKAVAGKLEAAGFQIARTDNADASTYERSCVIAYKGKSDGAQRIAQLLNCDMRVETTPGDKVDVTVIVGRDYTP